MLMTVPRRCFYGSLFIVTGVIYMTVINNLSACILLKVNLGSGVTYVWERAADSVYHWCSLLLVHLFI